MDRNRPFNHKHQWRRVILEKLIVAQLVQKELLKFITAMDYLLGLLYSQQPVTGIYPEPPESHPHPYSLFSRILVLIIIIIIIIIIRVPARQIREFYTFIVSRALRHSLSTRCVIAANDISRFSEFFGKNIASFEDTFSIRECV
jgi:hypothetical protein